MTVTTYDVALPQHFDAPLLNPTGFGLYAATEWPDTPGPLRHNGVEIRPTGNYGGEAAFGLWGAGVCGMEVVVTIDADGGTFDIIVDDDTATASYTAPTTGVRGALEALDSVGDGGVAVISDGDNGYILIFSRTHTVAVDGTDLTGAGLIDVSPYIKTGERPEILDPFDPITAWAYDQCDLTAPSRAEVEARAQQILRLEEQVSVERQFAGRMLLDANDLPGSIQTATDLRAAVGYLEGQMALTNTLGFFHAGAQWASQEIGLAIKQGTKWVTPLGHTWIFGGGYVDGLDDTIVATSQPFGWRDEPVVRAAIDPHRNIYLAVAERSVVIGYEHLITAVTITP